MTPPFFWSRQAWYVKPIWEGRLSQLALEGADGGVKFSYVDPSHSLLQRGVIRSLEILTGQPKLRRLYLDWQDEGRPHSEFFEAALEKLELTVDYDREALLSFPSEGPLVIVANHPYGVVDGLMICWLTSQVRTDFKILTNAVLCQAEEIADKVLPVDFSGTKEALATNLLSRKVARDHLRQGGAVIVFPAGGVSTTPRVFGRNVAVDVDWQPFTSHLIRTSRATVGPLFFDGQNSLAFQVASHLSPTLRAGLLFNEVRRLIGAQLRVVVGAPIPFEDISHLEDRASLATHLQRLTYELGGR